MKIISSLLILLGIILSMAGCRTAAEHRHSLANRDDERLTVGTVQREIKKGMSQADVAQALGSPNIVTRDSEGRETWIYDKISTEYSYSKDSGGAGVLILGASGDVGGAGGAGYQASSGAAATSQRTLTIILKFKKGVVDAFSYHSSRF